MAKKGGYSNAGRLNDLKEIFEDFVDCYPEGLTYFFARDEDAKHSQALLKAAEYFNIDLAQDGGQYLLLQLLAEVAFPRTGRRRGSGQWGIKRLKALGNHWLEVQGDFPGISDNRAATEIKKRYKKLYQSATAIRPRLPDARIIVGAKIKLPEIALDSKGRPTLGARFRAIDHRMNQVLRELEIWIEDLENLPRKNRRAVLRGVPNIMSRLESMEARRRQFFGMLDEDDHAPSSCVPVK